MSRVVVFLLLLAGLIGVAIWYQPLIQTNENYRKRILELEALVKREEMENRRLEAEIRALQSDHRTVERMAREKLNMARPGETVIRFEESPASRAGAPSAATAHSP